MSRTAWADHPNPPPTGGLTGVKGPRRGMKGPRTVVKALCVGVKGGLHG